jgi:hypothetical protein
MEKPSIRTLTNVQSAGDSASRKPLREGLSSEVSRDKTEICGSGKEKTPELNNQGNISRNFADLIKFGPIYGHVPSPYFEQFSGMCVEDRYVDV